MIVQVACVQGPARPLRWALINTISHHHHHLCIRPHDKVCPSCVSTRCRDAHRNEGTIKGGRDGWGTQVLRYPDPIRSALATGTPPYRGCLVVSSWATGRPQSRRSRCRFHPHCSDHKLVHCTCVTTVGVYTVSTSWMLHLRASSSSSDASEWSSEHPPDDICEIS